MSSLENFQMAFGGNTAGIRRECHCGKTYYTSCSGYDFDEGELEALEGSPDAFDRDYSIGTIHFEGKEYADACDCWHKRAEMIMGFLDGHRYGIAKYLNAEKQDKLKEAESMITVEADE